MSSADGVVGPPGAGLAPPPSRFQVHSDGCGSGGGSGSGSRGGGGSRCDERKSSGEAQEMVFSFGIIADVQYADCDDGTNFAGDRTRRFRQSLQILQQAVGWWNKQLTPITFIAQLGDLIDGRCKALHQSQQCLGETLNALSKASCPRVLHVLGNHELYNYNRTDLRGKLVSDAGETWYDMVPALGWRVIGLDAFDISMMNGDNEASTAQAFSILEKVNPNNLKAACDWTAGLKGDDLRFLPYNGAIGHAQMQWLGETLKACARNRERVIILSHIPFQPGSCNPRCLVWNYQEVLDLFHSNACVVACLTGHDHDGGYAVDEAGIHHITFEAPLECTPDQVAYAAMDVFGDRLVLRGQGRVASRELPLRPRIQ